MIQKAGGYRATIVTRGHLRERRSTARCRQADPWAQGAPRASVSRGIGLRMPKIDIGAVPERKGTGYPAPFDAPSAQRVRQRLGKCRQADGFRRHLMRLPPGNVEQRTGTATKTNSSMYWRRTDADRRRGETCCAPAIARFCQRLRQRPSFDQQIGRHGGLPRSRFARAADVTICSDIDMMSTNEDGRFTHKDGTPIRGRRDDVHVAILTILTRLST